MENIIVITGASSGIGQATAKLFAEKGWQVIATMRNTEHQNELKKYDNIKLLTLDVTNNASIVKAKERILEQYDHIDVLFNNAGFAINGLFESTTNVQVHAQFETNVFGLMSVTRIFLPVFRSQHSGLIINTSSMGGRITFPLLSLYHASKFAVEGFSESLSFELSSQNIRVKLIEPGSTITDFSGRSMEIVDGNDLYDYRDFMIKYRQSRKNYLNSPRSSAEDVANQVFLAATDNSPKIRYVIGNDAINYIKFRTANGADESIQQIKKQFNIK